MYLCDYTDAIGAGRIAGNTRAMVVAERILEDASDGWAEPLPPQCPPPTAVDTDWPCVYRFLTGPAASPEAFHSHAALGKRMPPRCDPCHWSSCSLTLSPQAALLKLPKFKKTHKWVAELAIPAGAGMALQAGDHIHFWSRASFNISTAVKAVTNL